MSEGNTLTIAEVNKRMMEEGIIANNSERSLSSPYTERFFTRSKK